MQLSVAAITKFHTVNKGAVDSICGFDQFASQSRPTKIAVLCAVRRNREYRKDVKFKAATASEADGDDAGGDDADADDADE